jgi:hypothetical protein
MRPGELYTRCSTLRWPIIGAFALLVLQSSCIQTSELGADSVDGLESSLYLGELHVTVRVGSSQYLTIRSGDNHQDQFNGGWTAFSNISTAHGNHSVSSVASD